jgi:hypothetical protein
LALPQAKPMKIRPKYGTARFRISVIAGGFFDWGTPAGPSQG